MPAKPAPRKISVEAYVYLVYLGMLFFQPIFYPEASWRDWLAVAVLIAAFLPLYFWTWLAKGSRRLWGVAGMVLLGIVSLQGFGLLPFFNSGGSVFFVYAAAASPFVLPRRRALYAVAAILGVAVVAFFISPVPFPYRWATFVPAFIFVPLIGAIQLYQAEKERTNARLRMAQDEIEQLATIAERERIARDLHDLLGHTLSVITLKSELASRLAERDPLRAAHEMQEVERISREALSEVRSAVQGYRSKGLKAEVVNAKLALEAAGISFDYYLEPVALTPAQEGVLALALREAVTNVVRHAQATRCAVKLTADYHIMLEVEDNGRGGVIEEGAGLGGMRERVLMQGGDLTVTTDTGTRLQVTLPQARALRHPASLEPTLEAS